MKLKIGERFKSITIEILIPEVEKRLKKRIVS